MARNVEQVGIFISTDSDDSGLRKVDAAADAATASLGAFSKAVATVQAQTKGGMSWLDANTLNPNAAKSLTLTATAMKRVSDSVTAMSAANKSLEGAMPDKAISATTDAFDKMALSAASLLTLSKEEAEKLAATATAMKTTASAANELARGYNAAATAVVKLKAVQEGTTAAEREEARALSLLRAEEVQRHNVETESAARARIAIQQQNLELRKEQIAKREAAAATNSHATALAKESSALETSRFAARELSRTYTMMAVGLAALPAAGVYFASSQERAFADVQRVTQQSLSSLEGLREEYQALSTEVPIAFEDLSQIGTLGAQMGIATNSLAGFSTAVGSFAAITNVSVEDAAMGFGRLASILGEAEMNGAETGDQYEILASQVAELGAATTATESEILTTSTSIAATGKAAGMSQDEILGYAAAFASLKIPSEWARGSMQRIFGIFNDTVSEGGDQLALFAQKMGMTSEAASKLWREDPSEFFNRLIVAIKSSGDSLQQWQAIKDLGFTSTRDIQMIQRLAVGYGTLTKSLQEATAAGEDSSFLQDSIAIISDTAAGTLTRLVNAFKNFMSSFGESFLAPLKAGMNVLIMLLNVIDKLPTGVSAFIATTLGIAATIALFKAAVAGATALAGSAMNVKKRMTELGGDGTVSLANLVRAWRLVGTQIDSATADLNQFNAAQTKSSVVTNAYVAKHRGMSAENVSANVADAASEKQLAAAKTASSATSKGKTAALAADTAATEANAIASKGAAGSTSLLGMAGKGMLGFFGGAPGIIATGAISLGAWALSAYQANKAANDTAAAGERLVAAMGDSSNLVNAIAQDTQEAASGIQSSAEVLGIGLNNAGDVVTGADKVTQFYITTQGELVEANKAVAESSGYMAAVIGDNTTKLLMNAALSTDSAKKVTAATATWMQNQGFSMNALIKAGLQGADQANAYVDGFVKTLDASKAKIVARMSALRSSNTPNQQFASAADAKEYAALQQQLTNLAEIRSQINGLKSDAGGMGAAIAEAGGQAILGSLDIDELGNSSEEASGSVTDLKDSLSDLVAQVFSMNDLQVAVDSAFGDLADAIAQNGSYIGPDSEAGRANLQAVEGLFSAIANQAAEGVKELGLSGQDAANYVHSMIQQAVDYLGAQGYDTTTVQQLADYLYQTLSQTYSPGWDDSAMTQGMNATLIKTRNVAQQIANLMAGAAAASSDKNDFANAVQGGANRMSQDPILTSINKRPTSVAGVNLQGSTKVSGGSVAAPKLNTQGFHPSSSGSGSGGGGGGGGGGSKAAKDAAKSAADEFKDFMSRLSSAMKDAMNSFWGTTLAQDSYHKSLNSMKKDIKDTKDKIADLRAENDKLAADLLDDQQKLHDAQFFNAIATKYGDTERMGSTQTDIGTAKADIADKQAKIAANNKESQSLQAGMYALNGYSDAAIKNRAALYDLQQQMVGLIENYAQTGASTQQVQAYTNKLKQEFINQATQMGFSRTEVTKLAGGFDALTKSIKNTPRTVKVNVTDGGSVKSTQGKINGISGGSATTNVRADTSQAVKDVNAFINRFRQSNVVVGVSSPAAIAASKRGSSWFHNQGGLVGGFAGGGLVPGSSPAARGVDNRLAIGPGGLHSIRSGEYVVQQPAVDFYGKEFMNRLNTMQLPTINVSGGNGSGISTVQLMPNQLMQLARAVSSIVIVGNDTVARASNAGNVAAGNRGVY